MTNTAPDPRDVPVVDLTDPEVLRDPFATYANVREASPLVRLTAPGIPPLWALTRHDGVKAMLADPRFELTSASYLRLDVPEHCRPYLRTMSEMNNAEHARLRTLVAPAFTPRRASEFRPRIVPLVDRLLDELPEHAHDGVVDLLTHFARPLPMDVICELVGIPPAARTRWREYGVAIATGAGPAFVATIPDVIADAKSAVEHRRAEPGDDLLSELIRVQADDGDRLTDDELVTLVWHLVLAGQTPANLIANSVVALFAHPGQLAALRADPALVSRAVEELTRWWSPQLLTALRYATEDVELFGVPVRKGEAVTGALASANRDPRAFTEPERLDIDRAATEPAHVGYGHGPHFCLGAGLARAQTEVALTSLLQRFPDLALAVRPADVPPAPDGGTWRMAEVPVTL